MKEIRKDKPGSGIFLSPPMEMLWTVDEFRWASGWDLSAFWCNWDLAIDDIHDRRVIRLFCKEDSGSILAKILKINHRIKTFYEHEMDCVTILNNKSNRKKVNRLFGYAKLKSTIKESEEMGNPLYDDEGKVIKRTFLEKRSYIDFGQYVEDYWNADTIKHKYYRVIRQLKQIVNLGDTSIRDTKSEDYTDYKRCKYYQSKSYKFVSKIYTYTYKGEPCINQTTVGYDKSDKPKSYNEDGCITRPGRISTYLNNNDITKEQMEMFGLERISFFKFAYYFFKYSFYINEER